MTTAAVIGLGSMGTGIAATLLRGGMIVRACDTDPQALENAPALIAAANTVLDALDTPDKSDGGEVMVTGDLARCVAGADLVIETIPGISTSSSGCWSASTGWCRRAAYWPVIHRASRSASCRQRYRTPAG